MPNTPIPPVEQRLRIALETTKQILEKLGTLAGDNDANMRVYTAHEKKQSGANLTAEERELVDTKPYDLFVAEWQRIQSERAEIQEQVQVALLPEIWGLNPALEIRFPATFGFEDAWRALLERLPEESQPDGLTAFLLGLRKLLDDAAAKIVTPGAAVDVEDAPVKIVTPATAVELESAPVETARRQRGPNVEQSKERIELVDKLVGELTTIYQIRYKKVYSPQALADAYPDFELWQILTKPEWPELLTEEFKPKRFAENLALRKFGLKSRETLKKDRTKLKKHDKSK